MRFFKKMVLVVTAFAVLGVLAPAGTLAAQTGKDSSYSRLSPGFIAAHYWNGNGLFSLGNWDRRAGNGNPSNQLKTGGKPRLSSGKVVGEIFLGMVGNVACGFGGAYLGYLIDDKDDAGRVKFPHIIEKTLQKNVSPLDIMFAPDFQNETKNYDLKSELFNFMCPEKIVSVEERMKLQLSIDQFRLYFRKFATESVIDYVLDRLLECLEEADSGGGGQIIPLPQPPKKISA